MHRKLNWKAHVDAGSKAGTATSVLSFCAAALLTGCGGGGAATSASPQPISALPASESAEFQRNAASFTLVGVDAAHNAARTGAGAVIGIIDDGLDADDPEFKGRVSALSRDFGYDNKRDPVTRLFERVNRAGLGGSKNGHGTKVASILAAARNDKGVVGVAPDATIVVLRADVVDPDTHSTTYTDETVASAIRYAGQSSVKVLNISLATAGRSDAIVGATEAYARTNGLLIWAAGNVGGSEPDTAANVTTANRGSWISVGGVVPSSSQIHYMSNRAGSMADRYLVASMIVAAQLSDGTVAQVTGTSFAAPQVAGAAALLLGRWPQLTGQQAGDILLASAQDLGAAGTDPIYGRGLLDIDAAIKPSKPNFGDGQTQASIEKISLDLPSGFGATELRAALSQVTILDAFGRDYTASLAGAVTTGSAQRLGSERPSLTAFKTSHLEGSVVSALVGFRSDTQVMGEERSRWTLSSASFTGTVGSVGWRASYHANADPARSAITAYGPFADKQFSLGIPAGRRTLIIEASMGGNARAASVGVSSGSKTFRLGVVSEFDTLFGSPARGTLRLAEGARTGFVEAEDYIALSPTWAIRASASAGLTRVDVPTGSIFRSVSPLFTTRASIDFEGAVANGAMIRFGVAQPTTVERGHGYAVLPVGYDVAAQRLVTSLRRIGLAADRRPFMLSSSFAAVSADDAQLRIGVSQALGGETSATLRAAWTF